MSEKIRRKLPVDVNPNTVYRYTAPDGCEYYYDCVSGNKKGDEVTFKRMDLRTFVAWHLLPLDFHIQTF